MNPLIGDQDSLNGAGMSGSALRVWDDGFGPLWLYTEAFGPVGVVRAMRWEDAWSCVIDEIMHDADSDVEPDPEGNLPEGCHFRGSGVPSNPGLKSAMAQEDLNGSSLEPLTPELATCWGIALDLVESEAP